MREQKTNESRSEYLLMVAREQIRRHAAEFPIDLDGSQTEDAYSFLDAIDNELPLLMNLKS